MHEPSLPSASARSGSALRQDLRCWATSASRQTGSSTGTSIRWNRVRCGRGSRGTGSAPPGLPIRRASRPASAPTAAPSTDPWHRAGRSRCRCRRSSCGTSSRTANGRVKRWGHGPRCAALRPVYLGDDLYACQPVSGTGQGSDLTHAACRLHYPRSPCACRNGTGAKMRTAAGQGSDLTHAACRLHYPRSPCVPPLRAPSARGQEAT